MKKLLIVFAAVAALNLNAGTGATTNWVAQFVREYVGQALSNSTAVIAADANVANTNGTTTTTFQAGGYGITLSFETADQPALIAQDCTGVAIADGVTNGYMWAWSDQGSRYINIAGQPIIPTATNFTYKGVASVERDGKTYLLTQSGDDYCEVQFLQIQKSVADKLKGAN